MKDPRQAPLFTTTWDFTSWILKHWRAERSTLSDSICAESLTLLDVIVLALKNIDRLENLAVADLALIRLRLRVRLAVATGLLEERQGIFLLRQADDIGRQIGGWLKTLDGA